MNTLLFPTLCLLSVVSVNSETCDCQALGDCVVGKILTKVADKQDGLNQCIEAVEDGSYREVLEQCYSAGTVNHTIAKVEHALCKMKDSNVCSLGPSEPQRRKRWYGGHGGGRKGRCQKMKSNDTDIQAFFDCEKTTGHGRVKRGGRHGRKNLKACASELSCSLDYSNYVRPNCDKADKHAMQEQRCLCLQEALPQAGITCGSGSSSSSDESSEGSRGDSSEENGGKAWDWNWWGR